MHDHTHLRLLLRGVDQQLVIAGLELVGISSSLVQLRRAEHRCTEMHNSVKPLKTEST